MSVNRNYLPYRAAREYCDRKMAKWMGFFLSEHTTALNETHKPLVSAMKLSLSEKLLRLNQAHLQQLMVTITLLKDKKVKVITGRVVQLSKKAAQIHTATDSYTITLAQILNVGLAEKG